MTLITDLQADLKLLEKKRWLATIGGIKCWVFDDEDVFSILKSRIKSVEQKGLTEGEAHVINRAMVFIEEQAIKNGLPHTQLTLGREMARDKLSYFTVTKEDDSNV